MRQIKELEFQSLGVESEQYFQGASTAFTRWDEVYVGIGNTELEAAEDSVECAASAGCEYNWESLRMKEFDDTEEVPEALGLESWDECDEAHFYVTLYVKFWRPEDEVFTPCVCPHEDCREDIEAGGDDEGKCPYCGKSLPVLGSFKDQKEA